MKKIVYVMSVGLMVTYAQGAAKSVVIPTDVRGGHLRTQEETHSNNALNSGQKNVEQKQSFLQKANSTLKKLGSVIAHPFKAAYYEFRKDASVERELKKITSKNITNHETTSAKPYYDTMSHLKNEIDKTPKLIGNNLERLQRSVARTALDEVNHLGAQNVRPFNRTKAKAAMKEAILKETEAYLKTQKDAFDKLKDFEKEIATILSKNPQGVVYVNSKASYYKSPKMYNMPDIKSIIDPSNIEADKIKEFNSVINSQHVKKAIQEDLTALGLSSFNLLNGPAARSQVLKSMDSIISLVDQSRATHFIIDVPQGKMLTKDDLLSRLNGWKNEMEKITKEKDAIDTKNSLNRFQSTSSPIPRKSNTPPPIAPKPKQNGNGNQALLERVNTAEEAEISFLGGSDTPNDVLGAKNVKEEDIEAKSKEIVSKRNATDIMAFINMIKGKKGSIEETPDVSVYKVGDNSIKRDVLLDRVTVFLDVLARKGIAKIEEEIATLRGDDENLKHTVVEKNGWTGKKSDELVTSLREILNSIKSYKVAEDALPDLLEQAEVKLSAQRENDIKMSNLIYDILKPYIFDSKAEVLKLSAFNSDVRIATLKEDGNFIEHRAEIERFINERDLVKPFKVVEAARLKKLLKTILSEIKQKESSVSSTAKDDVKIDALPITDAGVSAAQ